MLSVSVHGCACASIMHYANAKPQCACTAKIVCVLCVRANVIQELLLHDPPKYILLNCGSLKYDTNLQGAPDMTV